MDFQFTFPYWANNIFSLKGKPCHYNNIQIGEILYVTLGEGGIPLITVRIKDEYYDLIKEKI